LDVYTLYIIIFQATFRPTQAGRPSVGRCNEHWW